MVKSRRHGVVPQLLVAVVVMAVIVPPAAQSAPAAQTASTAQTRPSGTRIDVPLGALVVDDGDTVNIRWSANDTEIVRILGIDTPETRHDEHDIPYDQAFGRESRAFAHGVFATARSVQILRASMTDPYARTLAYLFVDGRNYSVMVIGARLAVESVTAFGDNGLPTEAAAVMAAAKAAGPVPFEPPHIYRGRMRAVTEWLKSRGQYPPP
jgi:micrococcal nuclease